MGLFALEGEAKLLTQLSGKDCTTLQMHPESCNCALKTRKNGELSNANSSQLKETQQKTGLYKILRAGNELVSTKF